MKGKGWRGNFLLSAAEQWLKLELTKNFKVIRDLELLPPLLGQDWSSVFLQRFDGAVTIWPRTRVWDWFRILSDPDPAELERMMRVGQSVTWPKLHMIENRHRLEKEILFGRQAVRKASQPRPRVLSPDSNALTQGSSVPEPSTGTRLPRISISPARDGSDIPLSVDTDAETAYANGTHPFFKPSRLVDPPGMSTPRDGDNISNQDPLRSPLTRRKWASELLDVEVSDAEGTRNDFPQRAPTPPTSKRISRPVSSGGFFTRFRTRSFPTLTSPFSSFHTNKHLGREPSKTSVTGHPWSSDSSSEDLSLDDRRHIHHSSSLSFRGLGTRDELGVDADSDSGGEDVIN